MSAADAPGRRLNRAMRSGCAVIRRANDHVLLIEGRGEYIEKEDWIGVVWLNENRAFYYQNLMRPGFARKMAKREGARIVETGDDRDCWPSRYETVRFEGVGVRG